MNRQKRQYAQRRIAVDQAVADLVAHFVRDFPTATADEVLEFCEDLQRVCEDHCCRIEIAHAPQAVDSKGG